MIHILLISMLYAPLSEKSKLIYVGDPMCSWCYGIAPELEELKKDFDAQLEFELVLGGLRPYNKQTMHDLKEFLTQHWKEVHTRSGQEFNYAVLNSTRITYDTEPPCRASMIVRDIDSKKVFSFFHATQNAFYRENKNMHEVESYFEILEDLGIEKDAFIRAFNSNEAKEKIKQDFKRAAMLEVNSFPTILLEHKGEFSIIAKGYASKEKMTARIKAILN